MKSRRLLILLAVVFQVGVVAAMAISRELILANGTPYTFQTAPIDPRDIFRGDYVRLSYLFSSLRAEQLEQVMVEQGLRKGQKVYLYLKMDSNGIARGERLYSSPPQDGPYLMGRVLYHWPYRSYRDLSPEKRANITPGPVSVKYGIEQYYVEQGHGRELEEKRGSRNDFQLPMLIHVRVSASGEAVISGYDWADIATKTEVVRSPEREAPDEQASAVVRFTLQNRSDDSITLPLKADNCSFKLVSAQRAPEEAMAFAAERADCANSLVEPVILMPGQSHSITFDLNRPNWYVQHNGKPTPMGRLPWSYRYRIAYEGDEIEGVGGLIVSRAFHGRGNID